MAKATRGTRILTWHEPSSQWRKMLNGRLFYLGRGRCKSDRKSYNEAVRRWREILCSMPEAVRPPAKRSADSAVPDEAGSGSVSSNELDVNAAIGRFLAAKGTEAKAQEITFKRADMLRYALEPFAARFGSVPVRSIGTKQIEDYRQIMLKKKEQGELKPSTINQYLAALRAFFKWAWMAEIVDSSPRNLKDLVVGDRSQDRPEKRYFSTDEIQALLAASEARHRRRVALGQTDAKRDLLTTAILLGLNCGYTQSDIADLKVFEVQLHSKIPRIKRYRSKTDVRSNHALWQATAESLRSWVEGKSDQDFVFRWEDGRQLSLRKQQVANSDPLGARFARLVAGVLGRGDKRRFRELRRTSANRCAQRKSPHVAAWFLAHVDPAMRSKYHDPPQRELDRMIGYLEQDYALTRTLNRALNRKRGKGKDRVAPRVRPIATPPKK